MTEPRTTIELDIPTSAAERVRRQEADRACECPRCGRMHHRLAPAVPESVADAALKAIDALRTPDASLKTVVNTVRQSIADVIEAQKRKADRYALALMMIREGCEDPRGFAKEVLSGWRCPASATAVAPQDCNWPFCGCDPIANKVIEALQESGALVQSSDA